MALIVLVGGIVSSVNHVVGFTAVMTAAGAGMARYSIILAGADRERIERVTAYGFHVGFGVSIVLSAFDWILG